jgi:hypothetical protein
MKIFQEVRGTFRCMTTNLTTSSIVSVTGLTLPPNNVYVSGFNVSKSEKVALVQCFNNTHHLYAFGENPEGSNYAVTYNVFMQEYGCGTEFKSSGALAKMLAQYRALRVSSSKKIVSLTIDTGAMLSGVLTGLQINVVDPEQNLMSVTLAFMDLDADERSGKGS